MLKILGLREWEARIAEVYGAVESFRMTSADTLAYLRKWVDTELKRRHGKRAVYPAYVRGFVRGMCRVRDNRIMRDCVEFCYLVDGVLYSTHKISTHRSTEEFYASGRGCELGGNPSGFYWKDTDRPYFVTGETTAFRGCADAKIAA